MAGSVARSYDFGSPGGGVLCCYDELPDRAESVSKESRNSSDMDSGMTKPSNHGQGQQDDCIKQDIVRVVQECMNDYSDNLLCFLEVISGRLSRLELNCYNIETSIAEFRSNFTNDQNKAHTNYKSLERRLQEVHRTVQTLKDRQELADTQKELTKFQKEASEAVAAAQSSQKKLYIDPVNAANQQMAITVPLQTASEFPSQQPQPASPSKPQISYVLCQGGTYSQQTQLLQQPTYCLQHQQSQPMQQQWQSTSCQSQPHLQQPHVIPQCTVSSLPHYQHTQQVPQLLQVEQSQHHGTQQAMHMPKPMLDSPPCNTYLPVPYSVIPYPNGTGTDPVAFNSGLNSLVHPPTSPNYVASQQIQCQSNQSSGSLDLNKPADQVGGGGYPPQPPIQGYVVYGGNNGSQTVPFNPGSIVQGSISCLPNQLLVPIGSVPIYEGRLP